ncbi:hypothetical protein MtrunA17_Chr7g0224591 [Medicago truncatula]|uniref:Transmembrane protein n=1 Tax=Medicago truncatula TaxID=3880 RepID=A0A396GUV6_MEDTR|nr:hypothetical protein MtrunA17_Chr7g0224591 [Medicago truncatula]
MVQIVVKAIELFHHLIYDLTLLLAERFLLHIKLASLFFFLFLQLLCITQFEDFLSLILCSLPCLRVVIVALSFWDP